VSIFPILIKNTANIDRCLAIARSHDVLTEHKNALALLVRASGMSAKALPILSNLSETSTASPPSISISPSEAQSLHDILQGELQRHRALVELSNLNTKSSSNSTLGHGLPLVERLHTYPAEGVDLKNIVTYPPKLEAIPVKPLFFDVAWNYIQYPGQSITKGADKISSKADVSVEKDQEQSAQQKKGWFGFGR
jgi:signal recognition particle subunit SRP68